MTKIEDRHDDELVKDLEHTLAPVHELETMYSTLLNLEAPLSSENLEELEQKIKEKSKEISQSLESLYEKIEENYQRKIRYNHGLSLNHEVGAHEFGDFVASLCSTPEEGMLMNEVQEEVDFSLKSLSLEIHATFLTYVELGYYPKHENFTNLVRVLKGRGIKISDKTAKRYVNIARTHLANLNIFSNY